MKIIWSGKNGKKIAHTKTRKRTNKTKKTQQRQQKQPKSLTISWM